MERMPGDDHPRPAPASLWPTAALVAVATVLVGLPLWAQGFTFSPLRQAGTWMIAFGSSVIAAALLRLAWAAFRRRLRGNSRRDVARQLLSGLACVGLLAIVGAVYSWGKLLVPLFRAGTLDELLYAADVALHLGLDPAQVLVDRQV